jgi:hypothetical protein
MEYLATDSWKSRQIFIWHWIFSADPLAQSPKQIKLDSVKIIKEFVKINKQFLNLAFRQVHVGEKN